MKRLLILLALTSLSAGAGETWIDPGVGGSLVYDQTAASVFENGSVVVASGSNVFEDVTLNIADIQIGTNDTANTASLTLAGGALTVGLMRVGTGYGSRESVEGELRVTGGRHVFESGNIADLPRSKAKLVIDGDDETKVTVSTTDGANPVRLPYYGSLHAEIRHGTLYSPNAIYMSGRCATTGEIGDGRFYIYDGGTLSSDKGIFIGATGTGNAGHAEVDMYGGVLRATHLAISYGNNQTFGGTCVMRQSGGLVDVTITTGDYYGIHLPETGYRTAEYDLRGGIVRARQIYHDTNPGEGIFTADGGIFQPNSETTTDAGAAIRGLTTAALGSKGLVIDTRSYATRINQEFSDLEGSEGNGLLVKCGSAALTVGNGSTAHSKTVVAEGSLIFVAAETKWTSLVVTNGATLSIVGTCAKLSLDSLTLGEDESGAVLAFDGTDVISVASPVLIDGGLNVVLNGVSDAGAYPVLSCLGAIGDATEFNWRTANVTGVPAGKYAKLSSAYDGGNDRTVFTVTVYDGTEPEADPIVVSSGSQEISTGLDLGPAKRTIEVAKDASLTVSGSAASSGFVKQGDGALFFTSDFNRFNLGVDLLSGLLGFSSMAAAGRGSSDAFVQQGGTLRLSDPEPDAVFPYTYRFNSITRYTAVVVETEGDVLFKGFNPGTGTLVKHGPGRLTIETETVNQGFGSYGGDATGNFTSKVRFDDNGIAPTNGFRSLQVAEGTLRLTKRGTGSYQIGQGLTFGIGMNTPDGQVNPSLTVDGADVTLPAVNGQMVYVGEYADEDAFWDTASFRVTNDASVIVNSLVGPNDDVAKPVTARVDIATGSSVHATYAVYLGFSDSTAARSKNANKCAEYHVSGGSRLSAGTVFQIGGPTWLTLDDGSVLSGGPNKEPATIEMLWDRNPCGEIRIQGHSTLCLAAGFKYYSGAYGDSFGMIFDDAVWETGTAAETTITFENEQYFERRILDGGLEFPVGEGRTLKMAASLDGTGRVVKSGVGTLVFARRQNAAAAATSGTTTLCCSGGACVKGGVLKVQDSAVVAGLPMAVEAGGVLDLDGSTQDFSSVSGAGTVRNGSLAQVMVKADSSVTFDNVLWPTTSRVYVDFDKTADDPLVEPFPKNVKVATLVGTTPRDVSKWRVANTGLKGVRGRFSIVGNDVMMSVDYSGHAIIIR